MVARALKPVLSRFDVHHELRLRGLLDWNVAGLRARSAVLELEVCVRRRRRGGRRRSWIFARCVASSGSIRVTRGGQLRRHP
jgi:hypothetical protein